MACAIASPLALKLFEALQVADDFWEKRVGTSPPGFLIRHRTSADSKPQPAAAAETPSTADGTTEAGTDASQAPRYRL